MSADDICMHVYGKTDSIKRITVLQNIHRINKSHHIEKFPMRYKLVKEVQK